MKIQLMTASLVSLLTIGGVAQGATLLEDNFDSGSITNTFRVYENLIDDGWIKATGYGSVVESAWTITGGQVENASTVAGAGYPTTQPSETPLAQLWSNPSPGNADEQITLSFDYGVGAGDSLYAHFWAVTGTSDDDGEFISNIEAASNGAIDGGGGNSAELTEYNLLNGNGSATKGLASDSISGLLTGTGTYSTTINVSALSIPGVSSVGDIDYFMIAFAKDENGAAGTTSIDNLSINSVPEPSSLALLGLGGLLIVRRRR